jgi:hypothetical protein
MTGSVHAALGAAIGRFVPNPFLAFGLGLASHAAGDVIPHHDMGPAETPIVFATVLQMGVLHGWKSGQFWGALGAMAPDLEHIPAELAKDPRRFDPMPEKFFPTHNGTLPHSRWPFAERWGVWQQVILFVLGLWLAGSFAKLLARD